ncbi:MAG: [Fe-Fe] hydrogenase large subunit C-terminal domain-containing protein [Bacilli bacterium]|nr:[Fe-Fe] hydrogenase large subunit C-terminal domain-containing protein [Bacilli bacterium]
MANYLTLKKSNCKNCYKCIRHCPVKSIRFSANQAHIVENECILCGQCFVVCPQDAKEIVNDVEKAKVLIQSDDPVYASIAPSFIANYNGIGIESLKKALLKLGFYDVEETAIGATYVKNEYEKMVKDGEHNIIISSCCNTVNLLIQKYFPRALKYLANVLSPMQAHCSDIKKRNPKAKTIFIGPCLSKKEEADRYKGIVDCVLTFEELTNWLNDEGIELEKVEEKVIDHSKTRLFPTTGGILKTMNCSESEYNYLAIDGVENCINTLKDIEYGSVSKCFIEMSACAGGCIAGPIIEKKHCSHLKDYVLVNNYAGNKDFEVTQLDSKYYIKNFAPIDLHKDMPSEYDIAQILKQMGKTKKSDELNCGSCGYNTCREKAIAIYQGKAQISMCLPYLKEKAESFSDSIVSNTPNALIVLNDKFEVQQINAAAKKLLHIKSDSDVLGDQVVRILDPVPFIKVLDTKVNLRNKKVYLAEYEKYVEQTIIYDANCHLLICIMRDVTEITKEKSKKEEISKQTIEIADKVVDKQMRIVQEIASLLGETAAETKIALTKLKESITDE